MRAEAVAETARTRLNSHDSASGGTVAPADLSVPPGESGTGWGDALSDLADRLNEHANGLRLAASGMTEPEYDLGSAFRSSGTV
ncbi:hypothetical protein [Streptomyces radicis]|uniref:hypothetical protein n=1 Tax=Streptomyces radicis TaxID=1750517 RepID=UPI0011C39D09|nr:hypothetical protein [Streptomyces radicis]